MNTNAYINKLPSQMLTLCKEGFLCDTLIVAGESNEAIRVHSVVLATASSYLKTLLGKQLRHRNRRITLMNIDYKTLCVTVYFFYTGCIVVPSGKDAGFQYRLKNSLLNLGVSQEVLSTCRVLHDRDEEIKFIKLLPMLKSVESIGEESTGSVTTVGHLYDKSAIDMKFCNNVSASKSKTAGLSAKEGGKVNVRSHKKKIPVNNDTVVSLNNDIIDLSNIDEKVEQKILEDIFIDDSVPFDSEVSIKVEDEPLCDMTLQLQADNIASQDDNHLEESRNNSTEHEPLGDMSHELSPSSSDIILSDISNTQESSKKLSEERANDSENLAGTDAGNMDKVTESTSFRELDFSNYSRINNYVESVKHMKNFPECRMNLAHIRALIEIPPAKKRSSGNNLKKPEQSSPSEKHICTKCPQTFRTKWKFDQHVLRHATETPHECTKCGYAFRTAFAVKIHISREHRKNESLLCSVCGKKSTCRKSFLQHISRPHKEHQCSSCDKTFLNTSSLSVHSMLEHGIKLSRESLMDKFTSKEKRDKLYLCALCGYSTTSGKANYAHKVSHRRLCSICGDRFPNDVALDLHLKQSHPGQVCLPQNYCNICEKGFSTEKSLKAHTLLHTNERPFVCKICGQTYTTLSGLGSHLKCHSVNKNRQPRSRPHATIHNRVRLEGSTNGDQKGYACSQCGQVVASQSKLVAHEAMVHSGVMPYRCSVCEKGFYYYSNLRSHESIHSGQLPYSCEVCGKGFRQPSHLKTHMHLHLGTKPYSCRICQKGYTSNGDLRNHYIKVHSVNILKTKINKHHAYTVVLPEDSVADSTCGDMQGEVTVSTN